MDERDYSKLKLGDGPIPFRTQIVKDLRGNYHIITALYPTKKTIVCDYDSKYRPDMLYSIPEGKLPYSMEIEIDAGDGISIHSTEVVWANSMDEAEAKICLKFKELKSFCYTITGINK